MAIFLISLSFYFAEIDVHHNLCNYSACNPRNYPRSNILLASNTFQEFGSFWLRPAGKPNALVLVKVPFLAVMRFPISGFGLLLAILSSL